MVESEVKLSWQKNRGKSVGLKAQQLSYGSLLSQLPATPRKLQRPPSPEDVKAPPLDSDDEIMQQPLIDDEHLEGSELDTPPKKLRDSRCPKPRVPRRDKVECTSPGRESERSSFNRCEPSNIRTSSFAFGGKRRSERHKKQERPKGETVEEPAIQNEDDMGLENFSCSQKRVRTTYLSNIHGSAPAHLGKKSPKKRPSKATTKPSNAFTKPDMSLINELGRGRKTKTIPAFVTPPSVPDICPTYKMRRSPRTLQGSPQKDSSRSFMLPSLSATEKSTARLSLAVNPLRSMDGKHAPDLPGNGDPLSTEDLQELIRGTKDKFKQPLGVQAPEPTSSVATSSTQSMMTDLSESESSLSSPAALSELDASDEHLAFINSDIPEYIAPLATRCPVCKEVVDQEFLDKFISGKSFRTLAQNRFHTAHQRQAAMVIWQSKGYPEIDWRSIDERLSKFHDTLENIINGQTTSYYRNALENRIRAGKHRTLTDMMTSSGIDGLSPGYYGSRGARVMVENIMSRFQSKIRSLAASDKIVAVAGVSGYVQMVLVPELAILVIMDDLHIDAENARKVIVESVDIGDLLNEEEEDEITREPDDEMSDVELQVAT